MKFYDREVELMKLAKFEKLAARNFFFLRITGRRRIGKTLLVREYLKKSKCPTLYFFVTKKKEKLLLNEYASIITDQFPQYDGIGFKDFDDFFKFLFNLLKGKQLLAVLDEFQNFKYLNDAIFSILQKHIDLNSGESRGMLLVIGSVNSMMRRIFEHSKQPLFGRLNGSFLISHFSPSTIREILNDHGLNSNEDLLFFYSIFEGIPFYFNYISQRDGFAKDKKDFFIEDILDESSILLNEGKEILLEEFGRDYSSYFSILEAIASGATTVSRIADLSGIPVGNLSRYISELVEDHELIERRVPFDARKKNKMGRYYLRDNFLDFWFRYIFKNKSKIEIHSQERIASEILKNLPVFMGRKFEKLVITNLIEMNRNQQIEFDEIGQYWDRGETEIDIIYTNRKKREIHFGECKLSPNRFNMKSLENKAHLFLKSGKYKDWNIFLNFYTPSKEDFLYKTKQL